MHAIASRYRELIVVGNRPCPVKMRLTQLAVYNSKIVRKNMKSKVGSAISEINGKKRTKNKDTRSKVNDSY